MLVHAQRIAAGQGILRQAVAGLHPICTRRCIRRCWPCCRRVPLWLFARAPGFAAGPCFCAGVVWVLVAREARGLARSRRLLAALVEVVGAAAVVAGFSLYRRLSSIWCVQTACAGAGSAGLVAGLAWATWKSAALAGLVIAAAFFTKQNRQHHRRGSGRGLSPRHWRRALVYAGAARADIGSGNWPSGEDLGRSGSGPTSSS